MKQLTKKEGDFFHPAFNSGPAPRGLSIPVSGSLPALC